MTFVGHIVCLCPLSSFAPSLRSGANLATNELYAQHKSCDCPIMIPQTPRMEKWRVLAFAQLHP